MNQQLKKGILCKVRILTTGEVVDAVYDRPSNVYFSKWHHVWFGEKALLAIDRDRSYPYNAHEVRFVGNPCVLEWV